MNDYPITKGRCGMKAAVMFVMTLLMLPLSLYAQQQQLEPPTISPRGENWYAAYYTDQLFTLSCETPNVTIKYFFDSYENEPNAVTYTAPFTLQAGDIYILYASYGPNYPTDPNDVCPSDGAAYYIFKKPVFSPEPGTYDEGVNVSVSYETITYSYQDVQDKLKYSIDGNTYNDYTAAISLSTSKTVNAYIYVYNDNGEIDHTPAVSAAYSIRPNLYFVDPAVTANQVKMDAASAIYPYTYTTSRPQLYNPHQLDVTWASSNTSVATVSSDGTVTIVGVGDTEISAAFAGNSDYVANTAKYTLHVDPQSLTGATVLTEPTYYIYSGVETKPTVTVTIPGEKGDIVIDAANYDVSYTNNINVGTATVTITGKGNYSGSASTTYAITKATPTVTAPTGKQLTYTGAAQELVNAGSTTGGTLEYSLDGTNYSANIPTASAVGTYTVSYRVTGGNNYNDVAAATVTATISASQSAVATAPTANSLTYTGSAQALLTAGTATNGTMQYSADGQSYSTTIPTGTNAGSYDVWYKVVGNTGYNDTQAVQLTVTIAKATPTVTAPTGKQLNYTGAAQELVNAGSTTGGTLEYSLDGTTYSTNIPTASAVGSYNVSYRVTGNANYNDVAAATVTAIISASQSAVATAPMANSLTYTGSAQALVTAGTATNGTMQYSADGQSYSTTIPTGTNAGSYDVWYKVVGNTGYNDTEAEKLTVTIAKASATVMFQQTTYTAKLGEPFESPTPTTTPEGLELTYTSSDMEVATVDQYTGKVSLVGPGTTRITAVFAGNDNYEGDDHYYTLTVEEQDVDLKDPEISFSKASASGQYGDASIDFPKFNNPHSLSPISWNSSDEKVAKVDKSSGQVTVVGGGETTISASFGGNTEYASSTVYYKLAIAKLSLIAYFEETKYIVNMGKEYHSPKIIVNDKPDDLEMVFVYTSDNENIAKVDAQTGDITPKSKGKCNITATYNGSSIYDKIEIQYLLIVLAEDENNPQVLQPIEEEKNLSFSADMFRNADGTDKDMTNAVVGDRCILTLKDDDYFDEETNSIVLNTVTEDGVVEALLDQGVVPGEEEWSNNVTGGVVKLPDGVEEGDELLITSQEEDGARLMVKVAREETIPFSTPEMSQKRVPVIKPANPNDGFVHFWHGGSGPLGDVRTRTIEKGKKTTGKIKVHSVAYKSSNGSGIQTIKQLLPIDDGKWYDLNGQHISKPTQKGIYILGHRKVVVK